MATHAKRQREQAKRSKREEKVLRKVERDREATSGTPNPAFEEIDPQALPPL